MKPKTIKAWAVVNHKYWNDDGIDGLRLFENKILAKEGRLFEGDKVVPIEIKILCQKEYIKKQKHKGKK